MTIYDCAVILAETRTGRAASEICSRELRVRQDVREIKQPGLWIWITRRFQSLVGEVDVSQLAVGHLVRFIAEEKRQGRKAKTIRNHIAVLRRVWRFAYTLQLTEKPPPVLDLDALVPLEKRSNQCWTVEQLRSVLQVIESRGAYALRGRFAYICGIQAADWWRALVLFLYHTAMRVGAALKIRTKDYVWNGNGCVLVCVREIKTQKQEWREYAVQEMIAAVNRIY